MRAASHPELLDWLAVEFMDRGWSLKTLHRLIVTSATYRQSSNVTPELYAQDPYNRLLARGPRFRVDAEIVRDIALAASGLLEREGRRPQRLSAGAGLSVPAAGQLWAQGLEGIDGRRPLSPRALHVPLSARCPTRCCRRSMRRTATSPACAAPAPTRRCRL